MIGTGLLSALIALIALLVLWRSRLKGDPLGISLTGGWRQALLWSAIVLPLLPLVANSFGWIFTEMGRQPWLVFGQMKTAAGVSANSAGEVLASMIILTLLYGGLAVVEVGLLLKYARKGLDEEPPPGAPSDEGKPLELVY